jgi:hypothetical protein
MVLLGVIEIGRMCNWALGQANSAKELRMMCRLVLSLRHLKRSCDKLASLPLAMLPLPQENPFNTTD